MTSPYILIPIGFLVVAFILRMPIAYGMIIGSIAYFMATGTNVGSIVHLLVNSMMNNYVLMAVPLYIFTANVMNSGAVTDRLYGFVNSVFSKVRGSSAQVNIYGSLLFAGMTGSSVADASGLGMRKIDKMGYLDMGMDSDMQLAQEMFPDARRGVLYSPRMMLFDPIEKITADFEKIRRELGPCDIILADVDAAMPNEKLQEIVRIADAIAERG